MKNYSRKLNLILYKAFSLITIAIFIVNDIAFSTIVENVGPVSQNGAGFSNRFDVSSFSVPGDLGYITDRFIGSTGKLVVHIQDAHCNYGVQRKISEIIGYMNEQYGINTVNMEGGEKGYDLTAFDEIGIPEIREKVSDILLRDGRLTGPENYAANNAGKIFLWGVEKAPIYLDNLRVYREIMPKRQEIDSILSALKAAVGALKPEIYSEELSIFDSKYTGYRNGSVELRDYATYLVQKAGNISLSMSEYPSLAVLAGIIGLEKGIDFRVADKERAALLDELAQRLSKNSLRIFISKMRDLESGRIKEESFYGYLSREMPVVGIGLSEYPELAEYIGYIRSYNAIDRAALMDEIERLEKSLRSALCGDGDGAELFGICDDINVLSDLFGIRLRSSDYGYYLQNRDRFGAARLVSAISRLSEKYRSGVKCDVNAGALDKYRDTMAGFYERSFSRDSVFLGSMRYGKRAALLVTGGFHSDNLRSLLRKRGISYVSIVPDMGGCDGEDGNYFRLLGGEDAPAGKALSQALSSLAIWSPFTENSDLVLGEGAFQAAVLRVKLEAALQRGEARVIYGGKIFVLEGAFDSGEGSYVKLEGAVIGGRQVYFKEDRGADVRPGRVEEDKFIRTPVYYRDDEANPLVKEAARKGEKTLKDIRRELDQFAEKTHERYREEYGFISRDFSPESGKIYSIFDRLSYAYDAANPDHPLRGRLFLVDSPEINAYVMAEHDDVYLHIGLVREMARYCIAEGIPFTEDMIAAVLAHELTHISQASTYEGVFTVGKLKSLEAPEIITLRIEAEKDADRGSIDLLSMTGYSPKAIEEVRKWNVKFVSAFESTVETPLHPKEQLLEIQLYYHDPATVLKSWDTVPVPLEARVYADMRTRHIRPEDMEDLDLNGFGELFDKASSAMELFELSRMAYERHSLSRAKLLADTDEARDAYARAVFANNLLSLAFRVAMACMDKSGGRDNKVISPDEKVTKGFFKDCSVSLGSFLERAVNADDAGWMENPETGYVDMTAQKNNIEEMFAPSGIQTGLVSRIGLIKKMVLDSALLTGDGEKGLYSKLDAIISYFERAYPGIDRNSFTGGFSEGGVTLDGMAEDIARADTIEGMAPELDMLRKRALCIGDFFNKDLSYREHRYANILSKLTGTSLQLESGDSGIYRKDPRAMATDNENARKKAYDILRYSLIAGSLGEGIKVYPSAYLDKWADKAEELAPPGKEMGGYLSRLFTDPKSLWESIGRSGKGAADKQFLEYLDANSRNGKLRFPGEIRSGIYEMENGLGGLGFSKYSHKSRSKGGFMGRFKETYRAFERQKDGEVDTAHFAEALCKAADMEEFRGELRKYFQDAPQLIKTAALSDVFGGKSFRFLLEQAQLRREKNGEISFLCADTYEGYMDIYNAIEEEIGKSPKIYEIMGKYLDARVYSLISGDLPEKDKVIGRDTPSPIKDIAGCRLFLDWYIDNKGKDDILDDQLLVGYIELSYLENGSKPFSQEECSRVLFKLSEAAELKVYMPKDETNIVKDGVVYSRDGAVSISLMSLPEYLNKYKNLKWPEIAAGILGSGKKAGCQSLFAGLMGLDLARLQKIARNQSRLADEESLSRADIVVRKDREKPALDFANILNSLVITRVMEDIDPGIAKAGDDLFSDILVCALAGEKLGAGKKQSVIFFNTGMTKDGLIYRSSSMPEQGQEEKEKNKEWPIKAIYSLHNYEFKAKKVKEFLATKGEEDITRFFDILGGGFLPVHEGLSGSNDGVTDVFFSRLADDDWLMAHLPGYGSLMGEPQIPRPSSNDIEKLLEPSEVRKTWLEALAERVELKGVKVPILSRYSPAHGLYRITPVDLREKIGTLKKCLTLPSLFRDGYIDMWERQVFAEVHKGSKLSAEELAEELKEDSSNYGVMRGLFKRSLIEPHLEWFNLKRIKYDSIPSSRRKELLKFYRAVIPLIFDPQRKIRYGSAALNLFMAEYPEASFKDELDAIELYMPKATESRDAELDALLEKHIVPSPVVPEGEYRRLRSLYTIRQKLVYDEELTNTDAVYQVFRHLISAFSRSDRMDLFLWLLDSDKHKMPEAIKRIEDRTNIIFYNPDNPFEQLPVQARLLPEVVRKRMLNDILTGENGLLNSRNGTELELKQKFADAVFDHYFPLKDNDPSKSGLTDDMLAEIKKIFGIVLVSYDQVRGASIIRDLVAIEGRLGELSIGKRLVTVLASIGPVGVKIGQYLSENEQLVKNPELRSRLGSLKDNAKTFNKVAVIDSLLAAGYKLEDFRVGKILGSASMKQVHEGWLKVGGKWRDVVFKVLRPDINRTIGADLDILDKVLAYLKAEKGLDAGDLGRTIRKWLEEEMDFRRESGNTEKLRHVIGNYRGGGIPVKVPEVYTDKESEVPFLMIEERVKGKSVGKLMEKKSVFSYLKAKKMREAVRRCFLYQVFTDGTFHADLHAGNVMYTRDALYFIDMGLIGSLTPAQKEAARDIVKGIILRSPETVNKSILKMIGTRGALADHGVRTEIEEAIQDIFMRDQNNITELFKGITKIVLSRVRSDESAVFSVFMKGFTQAIWLFPDKGLNAILSLIAVARATGMSRGEYFRAIRVHLFPWMGRTIKGHAELFNGIFTGVRVWLAAKKDTISDLLAKKKLYEEAVKGIDDMIGKLEKLHVDANKKEAEKEKEEVPPSRVKVGFIFDHLRQSIIMIDDSAEREKEREAERAKMFKSELPEDRIVRTAGYSKQGRSGLFPAILYDLKTVGEISRRNTGVTSGEMEYAYTIYARLNAALSSGSKAELDVKTSVFGKDTPGQDIFALWIAMRREYREYDDAHATKAACDLIARVLARSCLKALYPDKDLPDIFSYNNPRLKYLAEKLTGRYLLYLDELDTEKPVLIAGKKVKRKDILFTFRAGTKEIEIAGEKEKTVNIGGMVIDMNSINITKKYDLSSLDGGDNRNGILIPFVFSPDKRVVPVESHGGVLPALAGGEDVRVALRGLKLKDVGVPLSAVVNNVSITALREGYGGEGAITVRVTDIAGDTSVEMYFTDKGYSEYLEKGEAADFNVTRYEYRDGPSGIDMPDELRGPISEGEKARESIAKSVWDLIWLNFPNMDKDGEKILMQYIFTRVIGGVVYCAGSWEEEEKTERKIVIMSDGAGKAIDKELAKISSRAGIPGRDVAAFMKRIKGLGDADDPDLAARALEGEVEQLRAISELEAKITRDKRETVSFIIGFSPDVTYDLAEFARKREEWKSAIKDIADNEPAGVRLIFERVKYILRQKELPGDDYLADQVYPLLRELLGYMDNDGVRSGFDDLVSGMATDMYSAGDGKRRETLTNIFISFASLELVGILAGTLTRAIEELGDDARISRIVDLLGKLYGTGSDLVPPEVLSPCIRTLASRIAPERCRPEMAELLFIVSRRNPGVFGNIAFGDIRKMIEPLLAAHDKADTGVEILKNIYLSGYHKDGIFAMLKDMFKPLNEAIDPRDAKWYFSAEALVEIGKESPEEVEGTLADLLARTDLAYYPPVIKAALMALPGNKRIADMEGVNLSTAKIKMAIYKALKTGDLGKLVQVYSKKTPVLREKSSEGWGGLGGFAAEEESPLSRILIRQVINDVGDRNDPVLKANIRSLETRLGAIDEKEARAAVGELGQTDESELAGLYGKMREALLKTINKNQEVTVDPKIKSLSERKETVARFMGSEYDPSKRNPVCFIGIPERISGDAFLDGMKREISRLLGRSMFGDAGDAHKVEFFTISENNPVMTARSLDDALTKYAGSRGRGLYVFMPESPGKGLNMFTDATLVGRLKETYGDSITLIPDAYTDTYPDVMARYAVARLIAWYKMSKAVGNAEGGDAAFKSLKQLLSEISDMDLEDIDSMERLMLIPLRMSPLAIETITQWKESQLACARSV